MAWQKSLGLVTAVVILSFLAPSLAVPTSSVMDQRLVNVFPDTTLSQSPPTPHPNSRDKSFPPQKSRVSDIVDKFILDSLSELTDREGNQDMFSRHTRGRVNRMPLHYGKRQFLPGTGTLQSRENELIRRLEDLGLDALLKNPSSLGHRRADGPLSNDRQVLAMYGGKSKRRHPAGMDKDVNINTQTENGNWFEIPDKKASELVDAVWHGDQQKRDGENSSVKMPHGYNGERFGENFRERRGSLARMPTAFGKRNKWTSRYDRFSPLMNRIAKEGRPAYEDTISRLQRLGITFTRGSRARLSRMPQLYGRRRRNLLTEFGAKQSMDRNIEKDAQNLERRIYYDLLTSGNEQDTRKASDANALPFSARESHVNEGNPLFDYINDQKLDLDTLIWFLKERYRSQDHSRKRRSTHSQANLKSLSASSPEVPEKIKKSSLSRMPITFGKKSTGVANDEKTQVSSPSLHVESVSSEKHNVGQLDQRQGEKKPDDSIRNDVQQNPGSSNSDSSFNTLRDKSTHTGKGSRLIPDVVPSRIYPNPLQLPVWLSMSRRSSLNRMPLNFGKRKWTWQDSFRHAPYGSSSYRSSHVNSLRHDGMASPWMFKRFYLPMQLSGLTGSHVQRTPMSRLMTEFKTDGR